ncbi:MAG: PorT family protein [Oligoflexia bacterium]|nr:PorT family protein [Oligoflexia bacterium]MBF0367693.1 PorT family protein [Oligoflexia bacterium]
MTKRVALIFVLLALTNTAYAFGLYAGANFSQRVTADPERSTTSSVGIGPAVGIETTLLTFGKSKPPIATMDAGLFYLKREIRYSSIYTESNNFLQLPLTFRLSFPPRVFFIAGLYFGTGFGNVNTKAKDSDDTITQSYTFAEAKLNKLDYGALIGIGAKLAIFDFQFRYTYGLANLNAGSFSERSTHQKDYIFLIGIRL